MEERHSRWRKARQEEPRSQRQGGVVKTPVAGVGTFRTYGRQLIKAGEELVE